jgi:hypothetical protein
MVGMGIYFIALRPALLPEDVRYLGLPGEQLDAVRPRLEAWLAHVFRVLGGYVVATGALTIALATTSFRQHHSSAAIGVLIGGATSIGLMAGVNFMINSDFKWLLLSLALLWAFSLVFFWFEKPHLNRLEDHLR